MPATPGTSSSVFLLRFASFHFIFNHEFSPQIKSVPSKSSMERGGGAHWQQQQPRLAKSSTTRPMAMASASSSFHLHNCPSAGLAALNRRVESSRRDAVAASSRTRRRPPIGNVRIAVWEHKRLNLASQMPADPDCSGFEPQNYLKERCKKCFRLREKHEGLSALMRRVPVERAEEAQLQKAGAKRTQSIPSNTVRRVSVRRVGATEEEEAPEKRNRREEEMAEEEAKIATGKEDKLDDKPKGKLLVATRPKASTTTVLLPKQRQISLGSAKSSSSISSRDRASSRAEGGGRNGWQFMGKDFGGSPPATTKAVQNGGSHQQHQGETESGEEEDLQSLSSYRTANSRRSGGTNSASQQCELFSARSADSLNSISLAESYKTGKSPPFDEDEPFMTPTSTDAHFFLDEGADNNGDLDARALTPTAGSQLEFSHLRLENQRLAEQCRRYRHERKRWTAWLKKQQQGQQAAKEADGQKLVEEALNELELMVSEYREENSALKCELDRIRDRDMSASAVTLNGPSVQQLEDRLHAAESQCEQLRKEREELQQEIEEMQDQYRVEEIEEFRELQRELEMNAKNCRILQFKLRKSERQREQLQTEKNLLAKKYQELRRMAGGGEEDEEDMEEHSEGKESRRMAELEQELRVAKEISVKLHNELELAEERRYRLEDELFYNKEKVRELLAQNKWREAKNSRVEQQSAAARVREVLNSSDGSDQEGLMHREVRDSLEREADLREQLRFTEADLQRTRTRMRELELENDELLQKYSRLMAEHQQLSNGGGGGLLAVPKRASLFRSVSEGNEANKTAKDGGDTSSASTTKQKQQSLDRDNNDVGGAKERKDSTVDAEQLCYMLAAMDAQANRICKQLEKLDGAGGGGGKEEKRRSLKGDIVPVLEELGGLLAEMKAIKEQLAKSQNISLTKSMILGSVLGDNNPQQKEAEEGSSSCSECEDSGRKLDEYRDSCDFYKRKNAELTEQMKDQWAEELRRVEEEADERRGRMVRQLDELKAEMEEQRLQARGGEKALEECRAELAALNRRLTDKTAELERAKEKAAGAEKGAEEKAKWEAKCKEMKADRIRLQAEVAQLRRRTDEAVQELEKMRTTHQHKEIAWIREKLRLEEEQKQREKEMKEETDSLTKRNKQKSGEKDGKKVGDGADNAVDELKRRIGELEKEKERLERELAESRAQQSTAGEVPEQQQQQMPRTAREGSRPLLLAVEASRPSRVDYKQIADNALRAAESLQRQYREYQRQYTLEVQRLNGQLGQLERELADRERRLRDQQQQQQAVQAVGGQQQQMQPPPLPPPFQIRRAIESPSMSSLTENTTWDSRLLDCSMTRSISPFKFPRAINCPVMQCRTADMHPTIAAGSQHQQEPSMAMAEFGSEEDVHREYRRTGSSGTNILYRIRREELSKGKNPSVRQMAKAFESFEKLQQEDKEGQQNQKSSNGKKKNKSAGGPKSPLFGLLSRASSTTDQSTTTTAHLPPSKQQRRRQQAAAGRATESPVPSEPTSQPASLPRGGRNPFKGMGSRIVERVRRSLSRSKKSQSRDGTPSLNVTTMTAAPEEPAPGKWK